MLRSARTLALPLILAINSVPSLAAQTPQSPRPSDNGTPIRPGPVRISGGVMAGLLLEHKDPEYPADARSRKIAGAVVLNALITDAGRVEKLTVITGPEALRQAATDAVSQWTYKPYQLNGKPVPVQTTVTVNFQPQS